MVGLALARTRLGRVSPLATPALVVAANLPDVDALVSLVGGREAYLMFHRGITHAVTGVLLQILLLTLLVWWLERRFFPSRAALRCFGRGSPWPAVAAGLVSHPLLDLLNVYGIRPWLPFDPSWVYGDLVFIVDPWIWIVFGGMAALAGRSGAGRLALTLLIVLPAAALYLFHRDRAPDYLLAAWPVAVSIVVLAYARGVGRDCPNTVLRVGIAVFALYVGVLFGARELALSRARPVIEAQVAPGTELSLIALPRPAEPFGWTILCDAGTEILWQPVSLFGANGGLEPGWRVPSFVADPRVVAAARGRDAWHSFARVPMARIEADGSIVLTDARYWFTDFCSIRVAP